LAVVLLRGRPKPLGCVVIPWFLPSGGYEHTKGRALCCEDDSLGYPLTCKSCRFKVQVRHLACRIGDVW
jgi:hypothetical protein